MTLNTERITAQLAFLIAADDLKTVERANQLMDRSRFENSAEHSWHASLAAVIFAPLAGPDVSIDAAIKMLLLHDLVEIDAGDHPIHIDHDPDHVAALELAAADRLFGLLPVDQGRELRAIWEEFEAMQSPTSQFAKSIDYLAPALQSLGAAEQIDEERDIVRKNLSHGRATKAQEYLPSLFYATKSIFDGVPVACDIQARLDFWYEADQLKSILRATPIMNGTRPENSGEHSWHVALWALVMGEHGRGDIDISRAILMMILHDIVEIDAGDHPIHGAITDAAKHAQLKKELAAADRLFNLLPPQQAAELRVIWDEFEAAETETALFAKSIDRAQPVLHNLANDGGSWRTYNVKLHQIDTRVGEKIVKGAPDLWPVIRARIEPWFVAHSTEKTGE